MVKKMKILLWGVLEVVFRVIDRVLVIVFLIIIEGIICSGFVVVNGIVFLEMKEVFSS